MACTMKGCNAWQVESGVEWRVTAGSGDTSVIVICSKGLLQPQPRGRRLHLHLPPLCLSYRPAHGMHSTSTRSAEAAPPLLRPAPGKGGGTACPRAALDPVLVCQRSFPALSFVRACGALWRHRHIAAHILSLPRRSFPPAAAALPLRPCEQPRGAPCCNHHLRVSLRKKKDWSAFLPGLNHLLRPPSAPPLLRF